MPRTETSPATIAGESTTTIRWALAALAVGMLIAAVFLP